MDTCIRVEDAFSCFGIKPTLDKSIIQMVYHKRIMTLQEQEAQLNEFVCMRAAYEAALEYVKQEGNIDCADISLYLEAIQMVAQMQEALARCHEASRREDEYYAKYEEDCDLEEEESGSEEEESGLEEEESGSGEEESGSEEEDCWDEPELDFGFPDPELYAKCLDDLEKGNFREPEKFPAHILAEAYYQRQFFIPGELQRQKGERYKYAKLALEHEYDIEYLYMCGYQAALYELLTDVAIETFLEAEKVCEGHYRECDVYRALSSCYSRKKEYKKAFRYDLKILAADPGDREVYGRLSGSSLKLLQETRNRIYLKAALLSLNIQLSDERNAGGKNRIYGVLEKVYAAANMWGRVLQVSEYLTEHDSYNLEHYFYKALSLMRLHRYKEALDVFKMVAEERNKNRSDLDIYQCIGECYEKLGAVAQAETWYKKGRDAQAHCASGSRFRWCLFYLYRNSKQWARAQAQYEQIDMMIPRRALGILELNYGAAASHNERERIILQMKKYMPEVRKMEENFRKHKYSTWDYACARKIAECYQYYLNDPINAVEYYELAISAFALKGEQNDYHLMHLRLMQVYSEAGNTNKSNAHAKEFMKIVEETYSDDWNRTPEEQFVDDLEFADRNTIQMAIYWIYMGNRKKAEEYAAALAKRQRKHISADTYALMGLIAYKMGNKDRAKQFYRLAVEKDPWNLAGILGTHILYDGDAGEVI